MADKNLTMSYIHHACNRPFQNDAVGRLLDDVTKRFPNKEALVFRKDNTRKTFSELHGDVNQLAAGLLQFGLKPGDRVGIWADENYEWVKTTLAISTAGSTDIPKAVALPNRRFDDCRNEAEYIFGVTLETLQTEELIWAHVNTCTSGAYGLAECLMLVFGCKIVFPYPSQDTDSLLSAIQKERCNIAMFFPNHMVGVANHSNIDGFDLSSLKYVQAVGNVYSPSLLKTVSSLLSTDVQQVYCSTECGLMTGHDVKESLEEKVSNVGFPAYHGEVKIVDVNTGRIVPVNTTGEVCFRGSSVFTRYWGDEKKTKEVKTENGWFRTGDLGMVDKHGMLSIIGRKDDMIIKGARNIYPSEIEHALTDHPKIKLRKVVAVPDKRFVNELCLCVVLKDGEISTEDEIKGYLKNSIPDFYIPRYILFMETFPMTETAKVQRKELTILAASILKLSN
ncbi:medium-chain acyl-CoA ligase ACSF2, mitochondrial-like [Glandiceps talaboti]